jgi:hypothetical protein
MKQHSIKLPDITDDELKKLLHDMLEMFGELPDPERYPQQFSYYLRIYDFYLNYPRKN